MTGWFRSWHGAPTDPKWLGIARKAGVAPGIAAAVAWALMDRASQATDRGDIAGYDADGLACFFGCEPEQVEAIVDAMTDKGMLEDGRFAAWERRQPKREDDSSERVRQHRERKVTRLPRTVTHGNAPDTDTDTDIEPEENTSSLRSDAPRARRAERDREPDEAFEAYNAMARTAGWPQANALTPERRAKMRRRLRAAGGLDGWMAALKRASASSFLGGGAESGWRADIDFLLQAKSFTKLMEGSYDDRTPGQNRTGNTRRDPNAAFLERLAEYAQTSSGDDERQAGSDGGEIPDGGGDGSGEGRDSEPDDGFGLVIEGRRSEGEGGRAPDRIALAGGRHDRGG